MKSGEWGERAGPSFTVNMMSKMRQHKRRGPFENRACESTVAGKL